MSVTTPKSGFPIVKLAIGLIVLSTIVTAMMALTLRQHQCIKVMVPIDMEISLGHGCPRFSTHSAPPKN